MIKKIPFKLAVNLMLGLLSITILFHLAVITRYIPYTIVWGGRIENDEAMQLLESFSLFINIFLSILIMIKGGYLNIGVPMKLINIVLWIFVVLFSLNTVGNIFAATILEKLIFTPLTLITAILCARLAIEPEAPQIND